MIIRMPEEIFEYHHRVAGHFTRRQFVGFLVILIVVVPIFIGLYLLTHVILTSAIAATVGSASIGFMVMKTDGFQPPEKILQYRIQQHYKYPSKRKYVMTNLYDRLEEYAKEENDEHAEKQSKKKKETKKGRKAASVDAKGDGTEKHSV